VVEPDVDEIALVMAVGGEDIFIAARRNRRARVPASLRRGRHQTRSSRPSIDAPSDRAGADQRMYLVDADGDTETARIALRRSFEETHSAESFSVAHRSDELRQSVAG
jgi:hypothetical protein